MPFCNTCGELVKSPGVEFGGRSHVCLPEWRVYYPNYYGDDDWGVVYAPDHKSAAEKWADMYDSDGDYTIVKGSALEITVTDADGEQGKTFVVRGEAVPKYWAEEQ